ncbi:P-loop containing nucleoside triphosphate hydrolase superfamily protein [Abeliophyllum distichum]|uniref:P-loop containing nucleoside triphosphate hydrolase superfamily protein n=1 Tax=Abeliophyllum distichum TaxID=126358 RepID=A0ABD1Q335_9LAMI
MPVGGIKREDMDIPPVVTILLAGIFGSGKSSFVNLMYSVLGRAGLIPFAQTSGESSNYTMMFLEEHNVLRSQRSGFCVYGTRGLDQNHMSECLDEVLTWMSTGIRHNQPCYRFGDETGGSMEQSNSRYVKRKVNCVIVVADLSNIWMAMGWGGSAPSRDPRIRGAGRVNLLTRQPPHEIFWFLLQN